MDKLCIYDHFAKGMPAPALRCPESVEPDAYGKVNLKLWSCLFVDKQKLHH